MTSKPQALQPGRQEVLRLGLPPVLMSQARWALPMHKRSSATAIPATLRNRHARPQLRHQEARPMASGRLGRISQDVDGSPQRLVHRDAAVRVCHRPYLVCRATARLGRRGAALLETDHQGADCWLPDEPRAPAFPSPAGRIPTAAATGRQAPESPSAPWS